ncbi:MAG: CARDB domain-containing protein [Actinomycetota bacterium]|nr:CARDB domain-containing protein [Actinomycetota bacterium]
MQVSSPRFSRHKRNPAPAIILAVVFLLLGCWIFNLTCGGGDEVDTSKVTEYVNRTRPIIEASNNLGQTWNQIKETLPQLIAEPDNLDTQLKDIEQQCGDLLDQAGEVEIPEGMGLAHSALLICLEQRYRAMKNYRPDLINALSAVDIEVYAQSLSEDMQELVHSDGNYRFFKRSITEARDEGDASEVELPDSIWISDWEEVSPESAISFLTSLKGTELHGLSIGAVTLNPEGRIDNSNVHHLPSTDEVSVTVNVENQGNRIETGVKVAISLYTEADLTPSQQEQVIPSIGPGETLQVNFQGLRPTAGGVRNILEVKVDPVPQEAFVDNNEKLIYFVLE